MPKATLNSLEQRLVVIFGLTLTVVSVVFGSLTYAILYQYHLEHTENLQRQLVRTVQAQAEVAVFARNEVIAQGVIDGILANPAIHAVKIISPQGFKMSGGVRSGNEFENSAVFTLHSPVIATEVIGELIVAPNLELVESETRKHALWQTAILLVQVLIAAGLLVLVTRRWVSGPVALLANQVSAIKVGSGGRLSVPLDHIGDEIGRLATCTNQLIEAAENALEEVKTLATTDPLTGLPNRRHFMAKLKEEYLRQLRYEQPPASVLMLDLDHFKRINDDYGHAAGDAVLCRMAKLIFAEARGVDTPGRLGGEEFAILLPGTVPAEAASFAERLRRNLTSQVIETEAGQITVTASIGIAAIQIEDASSEESLNRADKAMYQAKNSGRNRVEIAS